MNVVEVRIISKNVIHLSPAPWEYWARIKFILWTELENDLLSGGDVIADTGKDPPDVVLGDVDIGSIQIAW